MSSAPIEKTPPMSLRGKIILWVALGFAAFLAMGAYKHKHPTHYPPGGSPYWLSAAEREKMCYAFGYYNKPDLASCLAELERIAKKDKVAADAKN